MTLAAYWGEIRLFTLSGAQQIKFRNLAVKSDGPHLTISEKSSFFKNKIYCSKMERKNCCNSISLDFSSTFSKIFYQIRAPQLKRANALRFQTVLLIFNICSVDQFLCDNFRAAVLRSES